MPKKKGTNGTLNNGKNKKPIRKKPVPAVILFDMYKNAKSNKDFLEDIGGCSSLVQAVAKILGSNDFQPKDKPWIRSTYEGACFHTLRTLENVGTTGETNYTLIRLQTTPIMDGDQNYHKLFMCEGFSETSVVLRLDHAVRKELEKTGKVTQFSRKTALYPYDDASTFDFINFAKISTNTHNDCKTKLTSMYVKYLEAIDQVEANDPVTNFIIGSIIVEEQHEFKGSPELGVSVAYGLSKFGKLPEAQNLSKTETAQFDATKFEVVYVQEGSRLAFRWHATKINGQEAKVEEKGHNQIAGDAVKGCAGKLLASFRQFVQRLANEVKTIKVTPPPTASTSDNQPVSSNMQTPSRVASTHNKTHSSPNEISTPKWKSSPSKRKRSLSPASPQSLKPPSAAEDPYAFQDGNPQPSPSTTRAKKRSKKSKAPTGGIKRDVKEPIVVNSSDDELLELSPTGTSQTPVAMHTNSSDDRDKSDNDELHTTSKITIEVEATQEETAVSKQESPSDSGKGSSVGSERLNLGKRSDTAGVGAEIVLKHGPPLVVGRRLADINLEDDYISREHAKVGLSPTSGKVVLTPLSQNHTLIKVNNRSIVQNERRYLRSGDVVLFAAKQTNEHKYTLSKSTFIPTVSGETADSNQKRTNIDSAKAPSSVVGPELTNLGERTDKASQQMNTATTTTITSAIITENDYFPDFPFRPRNATTGELLPDNRQKKRPCSSPCWDSLRLLRPGHRYGKHTHVCIHPTAGGGVCGHTRFLQHDTNVYKASTAASDHHKTHSSSIEISTPKRKGSIQRETSSETLPRKLVEPSPSTPRARKRSKNSNAPTGGIKHDAKETRELDSNEAADTFQPTSSSLTARDTTAIPKSNRRNQRLATLTDDTLVNNDDDNDAPPWRHLLQKDGKPLFELTDEEKKFWTEYRDLCDDDNYRPLNASLFEDLQKKVISKYPYNVFAFREYIRKHGNDEELTYTRSMQRYDHWISEKKASKSTLRNWFEPLWESMKPTQEDADVQANVEKTLPKFYKKYIAPFEESMRFSQMAVLSNLNTSLSPTTQPPHRIDDDTLRERIDLSQKWVSQLKVPAAMLELFHKQSSAILEQLDERKATKEVYGNPKVVPILGNSRIGKSFFLNQILAMTEVPASSYNESQQGLSPASKSLDAAHIATRVYMDDRGVIPSDAKYQQFFERICETTEPISLSTSRSHMYSSTFPSVEWKIPRIYNLGVDGQKVSGIDFTEDCTINSQRERYKHASPDDVLEAFQKFMKVDGPKPKTKICDFLLPSRPDQTSVTSHNTYVWGGEQYAMVVRFVSAAQIEAWIATVTDLSMKDEGYQKSVQKVLLNVLYTLEFGAQSSHATHDEASDARIQCKDTIAKWMKSKELPQWWKEKGSICDEHTSTYKNVHESVQAQFGKIQIFQGAGKYPHDDRVYINSILATLMGNEFASRLIAEVHIIAPSWLVTRHSALVDTPGAGDADGAKFPRVRDVVNKADAFIVYLEKSIDNEEATRNLLRDHKIYERIAAGWVAQPRKHAVLFVDSDEKMAIEVPRPLEPDHEESMIGEKWTAKLTTRRKKFEDSLQEHLVDTVGELIADDAGDFEKAFKDKYNEPSFVRREIGKPIATERHKAVFTAMHRAIIESMYMKPDDGTLSRNEEVTGMSFTIGEIWGMLNKEISTKSLTDFTNLCDRIADAAEPIANRRVPPQLREVMELLLKKPIQHQHLRESIEESINLDSEAFMQSFTDESTSASQWISTTANDLVVGIRIAFANVSAKLSKKRKAEIQHTDFTEIRNGIDVILSDETTLFPSNNPTVINREVFEACKIALSTETLWESSLKHHVRQCLQNVQMKFEDHCCTTANVSTDEVALNHIKDVTATHFNINVKVNVVKSAFDILTSNHDTKGHAATYLRKESPMHTVLDKFIKHIFNEGYERSGTTAEDTKRALDAFFSNITDDAMGAVMRKLLAKGLCDIVKEDTRVISQPPLTWSKTIVSTRLVSMFQGSAGRPTRTLLKTIFTTIASTEKTMDENDKKIPASLKETSKEIENLARCRGKFERNRTNEVLKRTLRKVRLNSIGTRIKRIHADYKKDRSWIPPSDIFKVLKTADADVDLLLAPIKGARNRGGSESRTRLSQMFPSLMEKKYELLNVECVGVQSFFGTLCQALGLNAALEGNEATEAAEELCIFLTLKVEQQEQEDAKQALNNSNAYKNRQQARAGATASTMSGFKKEQDRPSATVSTMFEFSKFLLLFSDYFKTDIEIFLVDDAQNVVQLEHHRQYDHLVRLVWDDESHDLYLLHQKQRVAKGVKYADAHATRVFTSDIDEHASKSKHVNEIRQRIGNPNAVLESAHRTGELTRRPIGTGKKKVQDLNIKLRIDHIQQQLNDAVSEGNIGLAQELGKQLETLKE